MKSFGITGIRNVSVIASGARIADVIIEAGDEES